MTTDLVKVEQLPVITERLHEVADAVQTRVDEALALQPTADTLTSVRSYRADLRKELDTMEDLRKQVKAAVMAPYEAFEAVYKACVSDPYRTADNSLKCKIDAVTAEIKQTCEKACREYFTECCRVNEVRILTFERLGVSISMTDAQSKTQPPKKLAALIRSKVEGIAADLDAISHLEWAGEVMDEYTACLNLAQAQTTVRQRHERADAMKRDAEERARRAQEEEERVRRVQQAVLETSDAPIAAPVVTEGTPTVEDVYDTFTFTVHNVTATQLKAIAAFMDKEGIEYD